MANKLQRAEKALDLGGFQVAMVMPGLLDLLEQGLGDRVTLIQPRPLPVPEVSGLLVSAGISCYCCYYWYSVSSGFVWKSQPLAVPGMCGLVLFTGINCYCCCFVSIEFICVRRDLKR